MRNAGLVAAATIVAAVGASIAAKAILAREAQADSQAPGVAVLNDSAQWIARNLAKFDTLDFEVFSHQRWDRFKESHAEDVIVTWPDGHQTRGLTRHIQDLKAMFVPMPDLEITAHPVKIANGSWTAVIGQMRGTFTRPMQMGEGSIVPTGKHLDLAMVTVGHWTPEGVMDREWLFWDNTAYKRQLGLAK